MFREETSNKIKVSGLLHDHKFVQFMDYIEIFDIKLNDIGIQDSTVILMNNYINILFLSCSSYNRSNYSNKREYDSILSDLLEFLHDLDYDFTYTIKDGGRITFYVDIKPF